MARRKRYTVMIEDWQGDRSWVMAVDSKSDAISGAKDLYRSPEVREVWVEDRDGSVVWSSYQERTRNPGPSESEIVRRLSF